MHWKEYEKRIHEKKTQVIESKKISPFQHTGSEVVSTPTVSAAKTRQRSCKEIDNKNSRTQVMQIGLERNETL